MSKGNFPYSFFVHIAMLVGCFVAVNKMSGFFGSIANLVNTLFNNVSWYIIQEKYERDVLEYQWLLGFVPDQYKTPEMCERAVEKNPWLLKFVPDHYTTREMCERAVEKTHGYWNLFLLSIKPQRCVKEL